MVQYFNTQFSSNLDPRHLTSKMHDISATRLPGLGFVPWWPPHVGDDVNQVLARGER